jgi:hypothetical protein
VVAQRRAADRQVRAQRRDHGPGQVHGAVFETLGLANNQLLVG